jgi:hypothetical protein
LERGGGRRFSNGRLLIERGGRRVTPPDETRSGDGLLQRRPRLANRAVAGGELSSLARAAYGGACTWRLGVGQQGAGAREACPCPL